MIVKFFISNIKKNVDNIFFFYLIKRINIVVFLLNLSLFIVFF